MFKFITILFLGFTSSAQADAVVALKTIRANTILTAQDVGVNPNLVSKGITNPLDVIGMETRVVLYAGRPIEQDHVGPPAIVKRNQIVPLVFRSSGLSISTSGRALDRGAAGDSVRVMNLSSKTTLFGIVMPNGSIDVSTD